MPIITINPWRSSVPSSPEHFTYSGRCLFTYRGVDIYKSVEGSWDYVFEGMTITQRAGFNRERAMGLIDGLLEGREDAGWVCQTVLEHLRRHGFALASQSAPES